MEGQKQKIVEGAKQYSNYIIIRLPQVDENGNMKYYFSGSLAMLLLSSASSFKSVYIDKEGKTIRERQEIFIPEKNREYLLQGVRPISLDVDIVAVDDSAFYGCGVIYDLKTVKKMCSLATELCPRWETKDGTGYFDYLSGDRVFEGYDIAELTLQDGTKIIASDPLCMIIHKFADGIKCKVARENLASKGKLRPEREIKLQEKYQKDIRDFTSMFNGIISLYPDIDFKKVVNRLLETCPETAFSEIMKGDCTDKIKQFWYDAREQIVDDYQNLFGEFIGAIEIRNKEILVSNRKKLL